jgi:3-phenylpropionate/trans-cinnamate dioxygenase ferredoxin reductase subunit
MLGKAASYDRLPYFFSDQFEIGMEYTGYASEWDEVVLRGDPAARELVAFWLQDGRVVAGMNMNVWDVTDPIKALIHSRQVLPVERLRDPGVPLEELLTPAGAAGVVR